MKTEYYFSHKFEMTLLVVGLGFFTENTFQLSLTDLDTDFWEWLQQIIFSHFRSLVDTVYALKDEVQELRQVGN